MQKNEWFKRQTYFYKSREIYENNTRETWKPLAKIYKYVCVQCIWSQQTLLEL